MAQLWIDREDAGWSRVALTGDAWVLTTVTPKALANWKCDSSTVRPTLLVRRARASGSQWVLLAGAEANVRVNGAPMGLASHILQDWDEILVGDAETGSWRRYCFLTTDAQTLQFRFLERRTETLDGAF